MDESSGSVSSHSEKFSDDQETLRASSPNHDKSPDGSSGVAADEAHETVKSLTEKLASALSNIKAKEDLVKQHAKVAEEAVLGWEKAETEVAVLKHQLDSVTQKKSVLEERVDHLDGALKECVRQLRQSREEQEQKINEALIQKSSDWESEKFELESRLVELQVQLEGKIAEATISFNTGLQSKLEAAEKEISVLKVELLALSEDLQLRTLERDLSTKAAETASKQHLESIKKVTRLEAECLRLRAAAKKTSDHKLNANSGYVESLTDSQSDSGERLLAVDNEASCSDSWASALIAELDQFKNDKVNVKNFTVSSAELDLMDDFLEMEKLAALLPEADGGSSSLDLEADSERAVVRDCHYKHELKTLQLQIAELVEKVEKMEVEKAALEKILSETENQLDLSRNQLLISEDSLAELQRQLEVSNSFRNAMEIEVEAMEVKRNDLESQLELVHLDARNLQEKVVLLEKKAEAASTLSAGLGTEVQDLENAEAKIEELESQLDLAYSEIRILQEKVILLEVEVAERTALAGEVAAKCQYLETVEATRNTLESQLKLAQLDVEELHARVRSLVGRLEHERECSAKFAANSDMETKKREMVESQLSAVNFEVVKLHEKVNVLERQVEEEMALLAESVAKCRSLEDELTRKKRETELIRSANSNGELKLKQEKELFVAAGKLAECQKTIASLSEQLRSLTSIEELTTEAAKPEVNGGFMDLNGRELETICNTNSSESLDFAMLPNGVYRKS